MTTWTPLDAADLPVDDPGPAAAVRTVSGLAARAASSLGLASAPASVEPLAAAPSRRRRGIGAVALGEIPAATAVVLAATPALAGPALVLATAVSVAWLVLVTRRSAEAGPLDPAHPLAVRVRCGAALALGCWLASSVTVLPCTPRELLALIVALALTSTAAAWVRGRVRPATSPRIVVVGGVDDVLRDVDELQRTLTPAVVCLPREDDRERLPDGFHLPVVVGLEELAPSAAAHGADAVLALSGPTLDAAALRRLSWSLEPLGIPLLVGTGLRDVAAHRSRLTRVAGLNVVRLRAARRHGAAYLLKDVAERIAAALGLVVLMPLLVGLAMAIRLDSRGSAVFRQCRVGRGGSPFTLYKFRTMSLDAETRMGRLVDHNEHGSGPLFKIRRDPRVTRLGSHLRRYSLDELPQLVNVVRGQMSLVGPRPALPDEVAAYQDDPRRRLVVKPGLTGLWQVSGRSDLDWEETVRLDLQYVDNWSLGQDLHILLRTVGAVVSHRGAY